MGDGGSGFESLAARPYADVLIIGGGINGLATFRDLALQGVDVALVERDDFVERRLGCVVAHDPRRHPVSRERRVPPRPRGGQRAQRAPAARSALRPAAADDHPDLLDLLGSARRPAAVPAPRRGRATRERGAVLIKVGLVIYDSFSRGGGRVPPAHVPRPRGVARGAAAAEPRASSTPRPTGMPRCTTPSGSRSTCCATACAIGRGRARAANYTAAARRRGRPRRAARPRDRRGDAVRGIRRHQRLRARGRTQTNAALGEPTRYMGGTKGSHIVLDNPELLAATGGRELFFENSDGRIVLIYPLKGRVLVGTTDLEHDMADPIVCTEEEVDYFIDLVGQVLPAVAGRPVRRSSTASPECGRCPATATSRRASSRATTAIECRAALGRRPPRRRC